MLEIETHQKQMQDQKTKYVEHGRRNSIENCSQNFLKFSECSENLRVRKIFHNVRL